MSLQNINALLKHSNEIGSANKPPMFLPNTDYAYWRSRFESYVSFNDPEMWIPITERYERPVAEGNYRGMPPPKPIKSMTQEERKAFDMERKTHAAICMCLPKEVLKIFKHHDITFDPWNAIEKRCGGNEKYKQSKLELVKKQFDLFDMLPNETIDGLFTRYSQLVSDLTEGGLTLTEIEVNKKLLGALPKNWDTRVTIMEDDPELETLTLDDLIGKLQAYALDMQKKECKSGGFVQNPSLYGAKTSTGETYGGMAFLTGGSSTSISKSASSGFGGYGHTSSTNKSKSSNTINLWE